MECKKCTSTIKCGEQPSIFCGGVCSRVFHTACVGLQKDHMYAITTATSIVWLCDDCMTDFDKWKGYSANNSDASKDNSKIESVHSEISDLKSKVDEIMSTLSSITSTRPSTALRHSTPKSSVQLTRGTNTHHDSSYAASVEPESVCNETVNEDQNFALLLTNIDGSVTENDIEQMVSRCLGVCSNTECLRVKKLVPGWIDCSTLDYVSFKVVLKEKWRSVAMKSSTWPNDIKFREFVQRRKTWKPIV